MFANAPLRSSSRMTGPLPRPAYDGGALPPSLIGRLRQFATECARGTDSTAGIQAMRGRLDALRQTTRWRSDDQSRLIAAVAGRALGRKGFGSDDFRAMACAGQVVLALLEPGNLDEHVRAALRTLAADGERSGNGSDGIGAMRIRMGAVADLAGDRAGEDFAAIARTARAVLEEAPGVDSSDFYALYTGFQGVGALAAPRGSLVARICRALHVLTDDAVAAPNGVAGITWMRERLYAVSRLTEGAQDPVLAQVERYARLALQAHPGFNTADWLAFQSTFQAIKAALP